MTTRAWKCSDTGVYINEIEFAFMKAVAATGKNKRTLSTAELRKILGRSAGAVRNSANDLKKKGFLTVRQRFMKDGGQTANEYSLTTEGVDLLRSLLETEEPASGFEK